MRPPAADGGEAKLADPKGRMIADTRSWVREAFDHLPARGGHGAAGQLYLAGIQDPSR